jgi:Phosphotransferase enzyme family
VASHPEETVLPWTQPAWRTDADRWIRERVDALGRSLTAAIEQPHVRPWATALRVPTDVGVLWFKATITPLTYEVPLLELLGQRRPDSVPRLVGSDAGRGWMLMEDAGPRLRDLYPLGPPIATWAEFLRLYAQLQLEVAPAADALVAAGVPDGRSPNLVDGFLRVLETPRLVRPPTDAALDDREVARLRSLAPRLDEAIDLLAAIELPDSVQHDDLHTANVCLRDGRYRFIDWGDACIAQPFLSLAIPLAVIGNEHAARARDAYLEPWTALRPHHELLAACAAADLLAQLTGVLKWELINSYLSDAERAGYEDVIPRRLRHLLELACG